MRDLVNAKVDPKRIEQIDFILKYFSVVKCLKNHVKIDFFRWWYFERFSRFVGEPPHVPGCMPRNSTTSLRRIVRPA